MGDGDLKTSEVDLVNEKIEENGLAKSPQPSASPPPATVMAPSSGVRAPRGGGGERKQLAQHAVFLPDHFKTFVVDSTKAFDSIVKTFRRDIQDFRMISVDSETTLNSLAAGTNANGCIDLLQIGTFNGRAFLFRLSMMKSSETNYLRNILADPSIVKMGSLFQSDARRLITDWGIYVHNWIDIQNVALNCLDRRVVGKSQGLKNMTKSFVGVELDLFEPQSMGNWSTGELSDAQVNYAAQNVMAVIDIFCCIYANRMRLSSITTEDIKQHIAWTRFYANAFYSAYS
ncbi:exonuclease 3'-5' domain-containing protein 2-like [Convolutriloba macropyga]|uniref:exonuclease 3'-5' domain-containing protein 2-like n=1 Tax=Convolutriloba macropyga TaxID=536237 RepID=UPI003F51F39B